VKDLLNRYIENLTQAHVRARASFSICALHNSVSVMVRKANETAYHSRLHSGLCRITAPKPKEDASADILVSALGSFNVRSGIFVNTSFKLIFCLNYFYKTTKTAIIETIKICMTYV